MPRPANGKTWPGFGCRLSSGTTQASLSFPTVPGQGAVSKGNKHSKNIHSSEKDLFFDAWELPHGGAKKQMTHKGFSSNLIGSLGCQEYWPYG